MVHFIGASLDSVNNYADAADKDGTATKNELAWKLNGSGWGTVYSKDYDPEIAENERGGGTWIIRHFSILMERCFLR